MEDFFSISEDSPVVIKLVEIWTDVLQVEDRISIHANFLDLGGDSLSAMLCISRIRREFAVDLDLMDFFLVECTIAELAKSLMEPSSEKGNDILHIRRA